MTNDRARVAQDAGTNVLTLFLYKVIENPYLKNEDRRVVAPSANGRWMESEPPLVARSRTTC